MLNELCNSGPAIRVARSSDIQKLLDHIQKSPFAFGPRLERALATKVLSRLLECRALNVHFIADGQAQGRKSSREVLALGISGFLVPELADACMRDPPSAFTDEVMRRESNNHLALLRPVDVARRNADGSGLDLALLAYAAPSRPSATADIRQLIAMSHEMFRIFHAGYHCRRVFNPADGVPEAIASLTAMGFRPICEGSRLLVHDLAGLERTPFHPFVVLRRPVKPVLALSTAEQDMLLHALLGLADIEIAGELGVSEEAIRKRWRRVLERAAGVSQLGLRPASTSGEAQGRGPEKRTKVLQYLATHLEELRPYG
jgi:DNA-binding NarL/FixJ family response regulator